MKSVCLAVVIIMSACYPVWGECKKPVPPEMPSDSPDPQEMDRAGRDVNRYMKEMKKYRECQMKIINDADNELSAVIEGWNRAVDQFKNEN